MNEPAGRFGSFKPERERRNRRRRVRQKQENRERPRRLRVLRNRGKGGAPDHFSRKSEVAAECRPARCALRHVFDQFGRELPGVSAAVSVENCRRRLQNPAEGQRFRPVVEREKRCRLPRFSEPGEELLERGRRRMDAERSAAGDPFQGSADAAAERVPGGEERQPFAGMCFEQAGKSPCGIGAEIDPFRRDRFRQRRKQPAGAGDPAGGFENLQDRRSERGAVAADNFDYRGGFPIHNTLLAFSS